MYLEIEVFVFNPSMFVSISFLIKKLHLILKVVQSNKVSVLHPYIGNIHSSCGHLMVGCPGLFKTHESFLTDGLNLLDPRYIPVDLFNVSLNILLYTSNTKMSSSTTAYHFFS